MVPITEPELGATYFGEQSNVPSFLGEACTHLVLSSFMSRPQFGGMFLAGLPEALRPPPVQLVTFERLLIMHWRVRVEPHALASVAHRRNEEAACSPSWLTLPPSASPRDEFDLGIGYMERKDYALAEQTMRNFAQKYPTDPLVADSQYWLGESLFQQQQYRDAAESFLAVSTKYETTSRAPEALLRLGQSLAALGEKEAACASLGEVLRKYPHATPAVKQAVDREQKRGRC